jgi:4-carboxymuconolactone decarboxylase
MSRLKFITRENFDEAQQTLFDHITKGKRGRGQAEDRYLTPEGGLKGPFNAWLYSPALGDAAQRLGEAVRFETALHPVLRELAILTVAARWKCSYEWWAHERIARSVGLGEELMIQIRKGDLPKFKDPRESVVYEFTRELIDTCEMSDGLYESALASLGETGVVELVTLIGYYSMVAMTLNVFKVPVPPGEDSVFESI